MKKIDAAIFEIDTIICKNIEKNSGDRGFLSQNILSQLRNYVEHISIKYYTESIKKDIEIDYENINNGLNYIRKTSKFNFLKLFHKMLQQSASHYTMSEENSERLMLKYYEYLLKIKKSLFEDFGWSLLKNLSNFPISIDYEMNDYYEKISKKINTVNDANISEGRYYVQKTKPFFINNEIYYEITFREANDNVSKFDRNIAFTKQDILPNYAVKLNLVKESVEIYGHMMPILIISDWEVSIRPCELKNFADILGKNIDVQANHSEYKMLMSFIKKRKYNLLDILLLENDEYNMIRELITSKSTKVNIFIALDTCRTIIINNYKGSNILRYLSYSLNNKIIKLQKDYSNNSCSMLSNLKLSFSCIPFEDMPFVSSLVKHNPKFYDLLWCIEINGREHELLARKIKINTEFNGHLYTKKEDLNAFNNLDSLVSEYNSKLYYKHFESRKIDSIGNNYFINDYEKNVLDIINQLKTLTNNGIQNYENSVNSWLKKSSYKIDCVDKQDILSKMFSNSTVSFIYGAAGTGKSTMINHVANFWSNNKKLLLANTNPAVDNLKRKVNAPDCEFKTIAKFLYCKENQDCDVLIIDECSTVSNSDMLNILAKNNYKLLVLVGDIYQIESITFGSWFKLSKTFINNNSIFELTTPYRTTNEKLLTLWSKVRKIDYDLIEHMATNNFSTKLDENIFNSKNPDEMILCLNYDGLYGINNINKFLQSNNPNKSIDWGVLSYKINDPVLFSDSRRFSPVIFNNLKGIIRNIQSNEKEIIFDIEIDIVINEMNIANLDLELITTNEYGSVIRFSVYKFNHMNDDDNDTDDSVIPFQVAYAVSIHKAQGLEFNSVKIIITNEVDELITHNILYTAITRAKENLQIYWTPETEKKVIENIKIEKYKQDESILKRKLK
ncbi:ATP-dependent RecD-like DNA helicase [Carnobacterium divergens]|uniref:Helicase n=1 Tax=Carnobacterium divergens TaxID=2748 RepID=A0A7Z8G4S8_CARDV|nr:ATP-dependent RecD-like DNA helicase [Carnobacterium divergens]TFI71487.1 helicase [Carnobacterium divergens]TFI76129.1 helicase [Carnobacterium divergens]TFI82001.1 helicase [Carnobacterium divergens]TFI94310.1 helicase [Carnobacterium divergens]TFJ10590.1 helicase [Carnobacterium divergens]